MTMKIPESPHWLQSKNRTADAEKSLQWLRGWVSKSTVAQELQNLQQYSERSKSCGDCIKQTKKCPHPMPTIRNKIRELGKSETLKPFFIVIMSFAISAFAGISSMSPFIVQIFKAYDTPIEPDRAAAIVSFVNNLANVAFILLVRLVGKRRLYLTALFGILLSTGIVCAYGFIFLPSGYNSFDQTNYVTMENKQLTYIPFVCIILWSGKCETNKRKRLEQSQIDCKRKWLVSFKVSHFAAVIHWDGNFCPKYFHTSNYRNS